MSVTLIAFVMSGAAARAVQPEKHRDRFVTLFGIAGAVVREAQPVKVPLISFTLFGISGAAVREAHRAKVPLMSVTPLGIVGADLLCLRTPRSIRSRKRHVATSAYMQRSVAV